ncbi:MAG: hypothetical protein KKC03_13150 [Bacteroidetes bacterium]|nr:hypothetical protein [Bacteroidota bacterium]
MQEAGIELQLLEVRKRMATYEKTISAIEKVQENHTTRLTIFGSIAIVIITLASGVIGWHINEPYHRGMVPFVQVVEKELQMEMRIVASTAATNSATNQVILVRLDGLATQLEKIDKKLDKR